MYVSPSPAGDDGGEPQTPGHQEDQLDFGDLGRQAFLQYWSDLANVSMTLLQDQALGWVGLWQAAATGALDPRGFARLASGIGRASLRTIVGLMAFPYEWSVRRLMSTPSLTFMVDGWAQMVGPQSAPTSITVPRGALVGSTDLHRIDGTLVILARHVQVRMASGGNRVEVALVDLADSSPGALGNVLTAGFYVGVVYALEAPNRRPLALIYVNVDRAVEPA